MTVTTSCKKDIKDYKETERNRNRDICTPKSPLPSSALKNDQSTQKKKPNQKSNSNTSLQTYKLHNSSTIPPTSKNLSRSIKLCQGLKNLYNMLNRIRKQFFFSKLIFYIKRKKLVIVNKFIS